MTQVQQWERPTAAAPAVGELAQRRVAKSDSAILAYEPMYGLWIKILGQLTVTRDGQAIRVRPAERTVLALLALAEGRPVPQGAFAEALWGDEPPVSYAGILHTYISRWRTILGSSEGTGEDRIKKDANGYRLVVSPDELDLLKFRQIQEAARRVVDGRSALELHDRALNLWRGQPIDGIDALRHHPSVVALADERVRFLLEFADAASAAGRHGLVLPMLQEEAARQLLNEAVYTRLIVALAGVGRQGDALSAYEELRRRLDEQLGVLPSRMLREAHGRVVRQEVPAGVNDLSWQPLFQLPAAPADFTGRSAEVAVTMRAVTPVDGSPGVPVVVICGGPGVGKTSLALHVAHTLQEHFPDGQLWIPLDGASSSPRNVSGVIGDLLRAMGVPNAAIPSDSEGRASLYRSRLAGRRILVVVDDASDASHLSGLIPGAPGCALLVTSRTNLVGLDGAFIIPLDVMAESDATALLARIIGESRAAADPQALIALGQACGSLPLALRIVGARLAVLPTWSLSSMVRCLNGNGSRLRELEADGVSVRASIATSYTALSEESRLAFRRLALLGPADFAEWVIGALVGEADVRAVTRELTARSLLTPLGADRVGEPRYRLHDLLRDYAAERLDEEPDADRADVLHRLLGAWLQLVVLAAAGLPAEPFFPPLDPFLISGALPAGQAARLTVNAAGWFSSEYANLIAAVDLAYRNGFTEIAFQLTRRLGQWLHLQDRPDDAERLWSLVLTNAIEHGDVMDGLYARLRVAASMFEQGRSVTAVPLLDRCAIEAEQGELPEMLALVNYWRAACYFDVDCFGAACREAERGLTLATRAGSSLAESLNLRILSASRSYLGEHDSAIAAGEAAVSVASALGDPCKLAAMHNLAWTFVNAGRYDLAADLSRERLALSQQLGDVRGEALSRAVLGDALHRLGDQNAAALCLHFALSEFREHHARRLEAVCLLKLGYVYEAMMCYPEAVSYLEESLKVFQELCMDGRARVVKEALDRCRMHQ